MKKHSQLSQSKLSSKSASRLRHPARENSHNVHPRPDLNHLSKNITSDAGRSPILSSRNGGGFKDHDGGDSFAVSL